MLKIEYNILKLTFRDKTIKYRTETKTISFCCSELSEHMKEGDLCFGHMEPEEKEPNEDMNWYKFIPADGDRYEPDEYIYFPFRFCPFCGEQVEKKTLGTIKRKQKIIIKKFKTTRCIPQEVEEEKEEIIWVDD